MLFSARQLAFLALASGLATVANANPVVQRDTFLTAPISKKANTLKAHEVVKLDATRLSSFKADASSSAPVVNEDVSYVAAVKVGSQTFSLIVDTGSSNTWVGAGTKYTGSGTATGGTFSVLYGSGSVSGNEYKDTVSIGSATVSAQTFGAATKASGFTGVDGIVGVGPVDLTLGSVTGALLVPTFLDNLKSQGTISSEVLGVSFKPITDSSESAANGELTFGGVDSSKYTGSIFYVPTTTVSPFSLYWGVDVGTITYGSTTLLSSGDSAIVDTGTTLIYLPILGYQKFLSATGGSTDSSSGLSVHSTKPTSTITINIGGHGFTLTPAQYLVPTAQYSVFGLTSGKYYSWINDGGISQSSVNFIIGQKFLENYYSVFDTTNSRIGFATAA